MILPFCQKRQKIIFSRKNPVKGDISGINEKDDIHPREMVFLLKYHID